jgi:hypothetical protein
MIFVPHPIAFSNYGDIFFGLGFMTPNTHHYAILDCRLTAEGVLPVVVILDEVVVREATAFTVSG